MTLPVKEIKAPSFKFARADELKPTAPNWLIRDVLEAESLAMLFGDPGTGKSFLALDLACCIAAGIGFHGNSVNQAPVIYLAGEGFSGIARRLNAWEIRHGVSLDDVPLFISRSPAALTDAEAIDCVIDSVEQLPMEGRPSLIVVDTLARNFGAADENSTADMNAFITGLDYMRCRWGSTVLLVHHTGHGTKDRARGAMALKAALDAEYRVEREELVRMEATKMKDAESPVPFAFKLRTVQLGFVDDEGVPVTSAVLDRTEYEPPKKPELRGKWQSKAQDILRKLYEQHRENLAASNHAPEGARVLLTEWRDACQTEGIPRQRFYDARDGLERMNAIRIEAGYVHLI